MHTVGIIPARSGSRRVKDKNLRTLGDKTLLQWTIDEALNAATLDRVIVSTDSEEYAQHALDCGAEVPFFRPTDISDDCDTALVVKHCVDFLTHREYDVDIAVTLQPTSPFRTAKDIDNARLLLEPDIESVVSVTEVSQHPAWMFRANREDYLESFLGFSMQSLSGLIAQDLPKLVIPNGAIYVTHRKVLEKNRIYGDICKAYFMPWERSIDIEEPHDFIIAEAMLNATIEDH